MFNWLKNLFVKLQSGLWQLLKEVISGSREIVLNKLKEIALNTVKELQNTDLKNAEKRTQAFDTIKKYAMAKGIEAGDSLINFLIELCVQKLKAMEE